MSFSLLDLSNLHIVYNFASNSGCRSFLSRSRVSIRIQQLIIRLPASRFCQLTLVSTLRKQIFYFFNSPTRRCQPHHAPSKCRFQNGSKSACRPSTDRSAFTSGQSSKRRSSPSRATSRKTSDSSPARRHCQPTMHAPQCSCHTTSSSSVVES